MKQSLQRKDSKPAGALLAEQLKGEAQTETEDVYVMVIQTTAGRDGLAH